MSNVTNNSKNTELRAAFKAQILSGNPFIFFMQEERKGKDEVIYRQAFFAQARKDVAGGNATGMQTMLLGWGGRILRATHNIAVEKVDPDQFVVGTEIPGAIIAVKEMIEPQWAAQKPKVVNGKLATVEGQAIYEWTELMTIAEYNAKQDRFVKLSEKANEMEEKGNSDEAALLFEAALADAADYQFPKGQVEYIDYDPANFELQDVADDSIV